MDLALNNLQRLICHKTQPTNQLTNQPRHLSGNLKKSKFTCTEIKTKIFISLTSFIKIVVCYHGNNGAGV